MSKFGQKLIVSTFSGLAGIVLTISYQHFFAKPQTQSFTFVYNGEEMVVTEEDYVSQEKQIELLNNEIRDLHNKISDLENEKKNLKNQIGNFSDQDDIPNLNVDVENYSLEDLYLIDSNSYEVVLNFEDSYGNIHPIAYKFIASYNAYAIFNLNCQYNKFSAKIVAAPNTGSGANMTLNLILDKNEADVNAGTYSGITKLTHLQEVKEIDISGRKTLTIETSNQGEYKYGDFYLVDVIIQ